MQSVIEKHFLDSIDAKSESLKTLPADITKAVEVIVECLLNDRKILTCGNGCSASNAQYLASMLLHRFKKDRPSLPAISLCSDGLLISSVLNNGNFNELFSKQIRSLGQPKDVLITFHVAGNGTNIIQAIQVAHDRELIVVALTGKEDRDVSTLLFSEDVEIKVPNSDELRIQEIHGLIIHCLCDLVDQCLFSF